MAFLEQHQPFERRAFGRHGRRGEAWIVGRHRQEKAVLEKLLLDQPRKIERQRGDEAVDPAGGGLLDQRGCNRLAQFQNQRGEAGFQIGQHVRQKVGRDVGNDAQPELPFHRKPATPRDRLDVAYVGQNGLDARQQRLRFLRQPHRLSAPLEQPAAEPFLHLGDLRRKRRLAHAGEFGGPAEMQGLGQCVEILHLPDCQSDHNQKLSKVIEKAICFYRAHGLFWNHSRLARTIRAVGGPIRQNQAVARGESP